MRVFCDFSVRELQEELQPTNTEFDYLFISWIVRNEVSCDEET